MDFICDYNCLYMWACAKLCVRVCVWNGVYVCNACLQICVYVYYVHVFCEPVIYSDF